MNLPGQRIAQHINMAKRGIENHIPKRAYRNRPLVAVDREFNRMHAGVCGTVERVFGALGQRYSMGKGG